MSISIVRVLSALSKGVEPSIVPVALVIKRAGYTHTVLHTLLRLGFVGVLTSVPVALVI